MKKLIKKITAATIAAAMTLALTACGGEQPSSAASAGGSSAESGGTVYKVGICNYVDDASLNQIVDNIEAQLETLGKEKGVTFEVSYDNCNADANVLNQIIANFQADEVDLMVGVATPVAMAM